MQSENFDNRIKEAAEQHHPNYDEKAWAKMEKLLDQQLPQKHDRRRRIIFFLLFFLFIGGGAWLVISKPWQQNNQTLSTSNTPHKNEAEPFAGSTKEATEKQTPENTFADKKKDNEIKDKEVTTEPVIKMPLIESKNKNSTTAIDAGSKPKSNQKNIVANGNLNADPNKQNKAVRAKVNKTDQLTVEVTDAGKIKKDKTPRVNNAIVTSPDNRDDKAPKNDNSKTNTDPPAGNDVTQSKVTETKRDTTITELPKTTDKKDIAKKTSRIKSNSFFFSFSAGPDVSSVGLDNPGKIKLASGAGFGYTFKNRWTIRTGFYTGRKVYSASRYDYKPAVLPFNYNYIDNIDADCKVYEIPVSLAYNFSQAKKHNLFASAGLSSYIMKKETYVYLYKYSSGQTYSYTKSIKDEYKHYFSVLTLSAGYQRKINKTFSIAAEPYIKVPLAGVGYGKVKLNSAGVLFSVNISPFQKMTKK